jgi:hypothetical protein
MIFRAVFWIGLVSLLAPHEQEFGLGRPGVDTVLSSSPATVQPDANGLSRSAKDCGFTCAGAVLSVFHLNSNAELIQGLAGVKAQIEQAQRERSAKLRPI